MGIPGTHTYYRDSIGGASYGYGSAGVAALPLDGLANAAAAYSFRKLRTAYTGNAIRIRRASDSEELDFGFVGNAFDTASVSAWLGGSDGFIKVVYDQSGNGRDITQSSTSFQPQYIASAINSLPAARFDGTADRMATAASFAGQQLIAVCNYTESVNFTNFPAIMSRAVTGTPTFGIVGADTTKNLNADSQGTMYVNGVATRDITTLADYATMSASRLDPLTTNWGVGQERVDANRYWGGDFAEGVILDDDDIASRLQIEASHSATYDIPIAHVLNLYIAAGQSNMLGADALVNGVGTQDMEDAGVQTEDDRRGLITFNDGSSLVYKTPGGPWGDIRGHLGTSLGVPGFYVHGPEVGFNRSANVDGLPNVAVIKFADNFGALESGKSPWVKPGSLYTALAAHINSSLSALASLGYTTNFKGFLWAQGIDDALLGRTQAQYSADLTQIISDLRSDFGIPTSPFIIERSVDSPIAGAGPMAEIRNGQVAVAMADADAQYFSVDDLTPYVNSHHLTSASQITAGERFYDQFAAPAFLADFDTVEHGTGVVLSGANKIATSTTPATWFGARADTAVSSGSGRVIVTLGNVSTNSHMVGLCDSTFNAQATGAFPGSDGGGLSAGWQTATVDLKWFGGASSATDYSIAKGDIVTLEIDFTTRRGRISNDGGSTWSAYSSAVGGTGPIFPLYGLNNEAATLA